MNIFRLLGGSVFSVARFIYLERRLILLRIPYPLPGRRLVALGVHLHLVAQDPDIAVM